MRSSGLRRRYPPSVGDFGCGEHVVPVHAQGVAQDDALVIGQRQLLVDAVRDLLGLGVHLLLGDPESRARHAAGVVFDLDAEPAAGSIEAFSSPVDFITVYSEKDIRVTFKNGQEIKA